MSEFKRIIITSGEPAGIGPEQMIKLAHDAPQFGDNIEWVVIGNQDLLEERAEQIGLPVQIELFDANQNPSKNLPGWVKLINLPLAEPSIAGELNVKNADYVLQMLHTAIQGCLSGEFNAMVTGPIHKGIINEAGLKFTGHTELLAEASNTEQVVMMLATPELRVPLVTTHLPLREIPDAITPELLESVIRILHHALQHQFGIAQPKIIVLGLNPHAGEDGHLGTEELTTLNPVIKRLKQEGMNLIGTLPADTAFSPSNLKTADAFLAMYHDQGLPVLKTLGFGKAVNITLGLPFVRTSVDHGTALEIAGTGKADINSLKYALEVAVEMAEKS